MHAAPEVWTVSDLRDLDEVKRAHVKHVLEACGGNRSLAARSLGVDRKTLYRNLARWGLGVAPHHRSSPTAEHIDG